jgi:hypothetical protein
MSIQHGAKALQQDQRRQPKRLTAITENSGTSSGDKVTDTGVVGSTLADSECQVRSSATPADNAVYVCQDSLNLLALRHVNGRI